MKVHNISQKEFENLEKLEISNTTHKDGELFYMPTDEEILLFKKFYDYDQAVFLNRIATIISLYLQRQDMPISNIVYPEFLVTINGTLQGYARKFVNGISLNELLENPDIPFEVKKDSLIQVGEILQKMDYVRHHSNHHDFYLNDIHEGNFMVEHTTGNIKAIDLDSASINNNYTSPSRYLRPSSRLTPYNKYFLEKYNPIYGRQIVPNKDTEIYCYSIMILNFLYGDLIAYMPDDMLQRYLDYLSSLDYNPKLLNAFSKLYSNEDNINPVGFLKDLHEDSRTNARFYQRVLRRKHS